MVDSKLTQNNLLKIYGIRLVPYEKRSSIQKLVGSKGHLMWWI